MLLPTEKILTKTLCFDCRAMGEPQDTEDRHHFGTHPALLTGFATDPKLQEHVQQLRREIEICKNSGIASIRLIVLTSEDDGLQWPWVKLLQRLL